MAQEILTFLASEYEILKECPYHTQTDICQMSIGYCIESGLAFVLVAIYLVIRKLPKRTAQAGATRTICKMYRSFYTSAIFLAFSIQIAAIVFLVRANFGISTKGMEGYTIRITWAISILCLLALQYGLFLDDLVEDTLRATSDDHKELDKQSDADDSSSYTRPIPYFICIFLSVYPFLSSMLSMFGRSQIGNSPGSVVSDQNWGDIESMCFEGIATISDAEDTAMKVLTTVSWLAIYLLALLRLFSIGIPLEEMEAKLQGWLSMNAGEGKRSNNPWVYLVVGTTLILTVSQFWVYFRLQLVQNNLAHSIGSSTADLEWGFGQVVAVTLFAPVAVELILSLRKERSMFKHGKIENAPEHEISTTIQSRKTY
jgi:hypothetical protein